MKDTARQRHFLSRYIRLVCGSMAGVCFLLYKTGAMQLLPSVLFFVFLGFLVLSFSSFLFSRSTDGPIPLAREEGRWFLALLAAVLFLRAAMGTQSGRNAEPRMIDVMCIAVSGLWIKLFLVPLHLSDFHFLSLLLFDSLTWLASAVFALHPSEPDVVLFLLGDMTLSCVIAWSLRQVSAETLETIFAETAKTVQAEGTLQRFTSYIMHGMRNPLSGAMLLVTEFRDQLRSLLVSWEWKEDSHRACRGMTTPPRTAACHCRSPLYHPNDEILNGVEGTGMARAEHVKTELYAMRALSELVRNQLEKMRAVCDDVLQLERFEKGGVGLVLSARRPREWLDTLVTQAQQQSLSSSMHCHKHSCNSIALAAAAGRKSPQGEQERPESPRIHFHSEWEEDMEGAELLERYPCGVADFFRLAQVIDIFFSNAQQFTHASTGRVTLTASVRCPFPEEKLDFADKLSWCNEKETTRIKNGNRHKHCSSSSSSSKTSRLSSASPLNSGDSEGQHLHMDSGWETAIQKYVKFPRDTLLTHNSAEDADDNDRDTPSFLPARPTIPFIILRVSVTDTGIGISPEGLPNLFRPYAGEIRAGERQNGGGTGLGLCMSKCLIEAHGGGKIWALSEGPDKGATFSFEVFLPLVSTESTSSLPPSPCPLRLRRPSHPSSRTPVNITSRRKSCAQARGGKQTPVRSPPAVPLRTSTRTPHGGHSGLSKGAPGSVRGVRHRAGARGGSSHTPLPPLTQNQQRQHQAVTQQQSAEEDTLLQHERPCAEESCLSEPPPPLSEGAISPLPPLSPVSLSTGVAGGEWEDTITDVLIVDDDRFCLLAASSVIKRLGFSVSIAESGEEALDLIKGDPQEGREGRQFRLILLDNNMPGLTGPETARKISDHFKDITRRCRQEEQQQHITRYSASTLSPSSNGGGSAASASAGTVTVAMPNANHVPPVMMGCTGETSEETRAAFLLAGARGVIHTRIHKPLRKQDLWKALEGIDNLDIL